MLRSVWARIRSRAMRRHGSQQRPGARRHRRRRPTRPPGGLGASADGRAEGALQTRVGRARRGARAAAASRQGGATQLLGGLGGGALRPARDAVPCAAARGRRPPQTESTHAAATQPASSQRCGAPRVYLLGTAVSWSLKPNPVWACAVCERVYAHRAHVPERRRSPSDAALHRVHVVNGVAMAGASLVDCRFSRSRPNVLLACEVRWGAAVAGELWALRLDCDAAEGSGLFANPLGVRRLPRLLGSHLVSSSQSCCASEQTVLNLDMRVCSLAFPASIPASQRLPKRASLETLPRGRC